MKGGSKTIVTILAFTVTAAFLTAQDAGRQKGASVPPPVLPSSIQAKVVGVLDGDTLRVANAEVSVLTIRLDSIDAPEMTQPYGKDAKKRLEDLVFGEQVLVRWKEKDKYGRLLGIVYKGEMVINRQLVLEGLAWNYLKYSKSAALAEAERVAKRDSVGLWKDSHPIAPWDWRDGVRPPEAPRPPPTTKTVEPLSVAEVKPEPRPTDATPTDATVYITQTGTHYHRAGCQHLRKSAIPIPLSRASSAYTPCSKCRPPT